MRNELTKLAEKYGFNLIPPAPADVIEVAFSDFEIPNSLKDFYAITNGLKYE